MLNNLTNFSNLIASRQVKTSAEINDLIVLGTKDGRYTGSYKPSAIKVEDLISQINLVKITYTELQNLVSTNSLVPGQDYLISGVDPDLYGGTDIIIKAATTSQLELQGHGIFYNPKYAYSDGGGIWTDRVTLTEFSGGLLSPFDSTFNYAYESVISFALAADGTIFTGGINNVNKVNSEGTSTTSIYTSGPVISTAIQPDGKIIIGGNFTTVSGLSNRRRIVRLNSNLTVDNSFNIGTTSTGGFNNTVNSVLIQPDGKVLIAGTFTTYKNVACKNIIRVSSTATTDATFTPDFTPSTINCMALQSDGKVLIGLDGAFPGIRRLNTDGTTDATFVIPGDGFNGRVTTIALQSDGKIIVGGAFNDYGGNSCNGIARLNTDGSFDNTFIIGTGFTGSVFNISIQADDKILVAGDIYQYDLYNFIGIARLNADGIFDNTFAKFDQENTGFSSFNCILAQPDGKILVGGNFQIYNLNLYNLVRFKESTITYVGSVVQDSTSGSGLGWEANIGISNSFVSSINAFNYGYGYQTGDTITILGSQIGGIDGEDDVILTVTNGIIYQPGDTTIWGGKVWKNLTGNLGFPNYSLELNNEDWEVIPYNTTNYNLVADTIDYHMQNNTIVSRKDELGNHVKGSINYFQWGGRAYDNFVDTVSFFDCVNFRGSFIAGNSLINESFIENNTCEGNSSLYGNKLNTGSIHSNTLENSNIFQNNLQGSITFYSHASIEYNSLSNQSAIIENTMIGGDSKISNNILLDIGFIYTNSLNQARIDQNILNDGYIATITLINGSIRECLLSLASIESTLFNKSSIIRLNMIMAFISDCNFKSSALDFGNSQLGQNNGGLSNCDFNYIGYQTIDISTANDIYLPITKTAFINSGWNLRLSYYDDMDTLIITNIDN